MSAWLFIQQETSSLLCRLRSGPGKWLMHFGRRKTLKLRVGEEGHFARHRALVAERAREFVFHSTKILPMHECTLILDILHKGMKSTYQS